MKTYIYFDNNKGEWVKGKWQAPVVFSCKAHSITEADKLYEEQTGKDPTKQKYVGCQIQPLCSSQ